MRPWAYIYAYMKPQVIWGLKYMRPSVYLRPHIPVLNWVSICGLRLFEAFSMRPSVWGLQYMRPSVSMWGLWYKRPSVSSHILKASYDLKYLCEAYGIRGLQYLYEPVSEWGLQYLYQALSTWGLQHLLYEALKYMRPSASTICGLKYMRPSASICGLKYVHEAVSIWGLSSLHFAYSVLIVFT